MFQSSPRTQAGCNDLTINQTWRLSKFQSSPRTQAGCNDPAVVVKPVGVGPFQSSPRTQAGCNCTSASTRPSVFTCFNPHPALRRGATVRLDAEKRAFIWFQSSPRTQAGCNNAHSVAVLEEGLFQSSPRTQAGCNFPLSCAFVFLTPSFNPHPALRRGATPVRAAIPGCAAVSILTPHSGGVQHPDAASRHPMSAVSILTPHSGGVQLRKV